MQRIGENGHRDKQNRRPNNVGPARPLRPAAAPRSAFRALAGQRRLREMAIGGEPALRTLADYIGSRLGFGRRAADDLLEIVKPSALVLLVDRIGDEAGDLALDFDQTVENRVALGFDGGGRSAVAIHDRFGWGRIGGGRYRYDIDVVLVDARAHALAP